ncbi:hypothetical protein PHJA_001309300 [Phtheirospermum japonicum]|uniref:Uncharacterized protein n=1 Tax=Phtheirospermum japonicum TaxID=374723 RepID=A0A830C6E2_9LAMI|nr:hypothetical protein PHJA_001309300 [Phtheirospermum japonicum]
MRIRKRFAPAITDLQLQLRSSEAAPPSDQPPDQTTEIGRNNNRSWVFFVNDDKTDDKIKQKEFGDVETLIMEANKSTTTDDIR